ncbi:MAG: hypothetical protein WA609_04890 [Terriglobales bacterium]
MQPQDYRKARDAAIGEIKEILKQRAAQDERLSQLKKTVDALSSLLGDVSPPVKPIPSLADSVAAALRVGLSDPGGAGISRMIRNILAHSHIPMTPVDIKAALARTGFDIGQYANAMAVIHNTLKRLQAQGELVAIYDAVHQVTAFALRTVPPPPGSPGVTLPNQSELADQGKGTSFSTGMIFGADLTEQSKGGLFPNPGADIVEDALGKTFKKK